jgi:hypothetical protein
MLNNSCNVLVRQFRMIRVSRERVDLASAPFRIRIVGSTLDDPRVYSPPTMSTVENCRYTFWGQAGKDALLSWVVQSVF